MKPATLAALVLSPLATAQSDRVVPQQYKTMWASYTGTGTVFGGTKGITQCLYINPMRANTLVLGVGFRRMAGTVDYRAITLDMELLLSSTTKTLATLTNTFASNLGNDATVVFTRKMFNVAAQPARTSSPASWIVIPAARPWPYKGPNLIVQMKRFAQSWSSTGIRNDRCFRTTNRGGALAFGQDCGKAKHDSASTSNYQHGTPVDLRISGAPAQTAALLFLGGDATSFLNLPLPLDMNVVGMKGCLLRVAPLLILGTATDGSGAGTIRLPIPNDRKLEGTGFATQYLYFDKSAGNTLGALMTNAMFLQIGPLPCANSYVFDLFSETKATGSLQPGGPVVMLRTP